MSQKLNKLQNEIDEKYYELLEAQLDQDWERAASIQGTINLLEKRENQMVKDTQNLRDHSGAV
jgi:protein-arginine kinase activator protein McsA